MKFLLESVWNRFIRYPGVMSQVRAVMVAANLRPLYTSSSQVPHSIALIVALMPTAFSCSTITSPVCMWNS